MTTIFFLLAIIFFLYELSGFYNPRRSSEHLKNLKKKDFFTSDEIQRDAKLNGCAYAFVNMFYMFWTILGLAFSTQWLSFGILFGLGIVFGMLQKALSMKNLEDSRFSLFLRSVDCLICATVIADIFMVHFQGDLYGTGLVRMIFGL
jgi:uncharacterized membrane protein YbaN (DUF454 family)